MPKSKLPDNVAAHIDEERWRLARRDKIKKELYQRQRRGRQGMIILSIYNMEALAVVTKNPGMTKYEYVKARVRAGLAHHLAVLLENGFLLEVHEDDRKRLFLTRRGLGKIQTFSNSMRKVDAEMGSAQMAA